MSWRTPVSKQRQFLCPFCGQAGERSKEHVWAQWLHETEGAKALLEGTHGERIPMPDGVLVKGDDGRCQTAWASRGKYAKWLPHVTVWVCGTCNSEWMGQLEDQTRTILKPFVLDGENLLTLSEDDLFTLATWATKSWMAYALTAPAQRNPFTEDEYRAMAANPKPLVRCQIWLLHAAEPRSEVGMGIHSTLFTFGRPDLAAPDNTGHAYLAVAGVVLFMALAPTDAPDGFIEHVLTPPSVSGNGVRRIWPHPRRQYFPLARVPDEEVAALLDYPVRLAEAVGLPTAGLTDDDTAEVMQEYLDGADPTELRRRWGPPNADA